jgi:hypothetical protein
MSIVMILLVLAALIAFLLGAFGGTSRWPSIDLTALGLAIHTHNLLLQVLSVA